MTRVFSLKLSFTPPPIFFLPDSSQCHYHPLIHLFIPLSIIKLNKHLLNTHYVANTGLIIEESKTSKNWSFVLKGFTEHRPRNISIIRTCYTDISSSFSVLERGLIFLVLKKKIVIPTEIYTGPALLLYQSR